MPFLWSILPPGDLPAVGRTSRLLWNLVAAKVGGSRDEAQAGAIASQAMVLRSGGLARPNDRHNARVWEAQNREPPGATMLELSGGRVQGGVPMSFGKVILVTAFFLSSVGIGISASTDSASASPAPTGVGTLTCSIGGNVTFDPPLTQSGTLPNGPGFNREMAYFALQLTDCTGPDGNTPQPNPTAATMSGKSNIHLKDEKVPFAGHNVKVMGACGVGFPPGSLKNTEVWTGGSPVKKSSTTLNVSVTGGYIQGSSKGSYPGSASGTLNLTASSSDEYNSVCDGEGDGTGSISELTFDSSTSTLTVG
jgi:hypothetical protein